jgi:hypothetical protein
MLFKAIVTLEDERLTHRAGVSDRLSNPALS